MIGMDVWVHGSALVALWVIAVAVVVLVLLLWGVLVQLLAIRHQDRPVGVAAGTAKSPAQPG